MPDQATRETPSFSGGLFHPLTPTQAIVVSFVKEGLSYQQIADEMGISPHTARNHVMQIAKLLPRNGLPAFRRVNRWAATQRVIVGTRS